MSLMMAPPPGISAFPASDSDMTYWKGRIEGPEGTAYENQTYAISLSFPPTYPYAAPTVLFTTKMFHPNVALTGDICLGEFARLAVPLKDPGKLIKSFLFKDILKEKWSPMLSVSTILVSLQSLLGEPNNRSPLNVEAADLWDDQVAFKRELAKHYRAIDDE
ncbi:hypothetical protein P7C70_g2527, partial [Phenoliferia sp. Uapishka_3]